ncbi:MAG TPA: hypothetical protein VEF92_01870 [Burkholderiales bacterium]|nr:hypothetical protein [Burkholderiales bacterium]
MRSSTAALLAGAALVGFLNSALCAEGLGRLFFTPQQRQDLDRRRQANIQESAATVNSSLTVNGQVSRSRGKSTVWINGVPQENARRPSDPARVTLPAGEGENSSSVTIKIGQTLDKVRGKVKDPIADGKIVTPPERRATAP